MSFDASTVFPADRVPGSQAEPIIQEARKRQRRRRRWIAAIAVLAILIGLGVNHWARNGRAQLACPSSSGCSQESQPSKVPDPCSLLTKRQAVALVGQKLAYRQPRVSQGVHFCVWSFMPYSKFTSAHPQITMTVTRQTRSRFSSFAKSHGGAPVRGVGTLAYSNGPNTGITILTVWEDGYVLNLFDSGTDALATEKAFAKLALENLPRGTTN